MNIFELVLKNLMLLSSNLSYDERRVTTNYLINLILVNLNEQFARKIYWNARQGSYLARSMRLIYQSEVRLCCDSSLPHWLKQFN